MEAGSQDAAQVTADDWDPPPARAGREGGLSPATTEEHQPGAQVTGGVDGVTEHSRIKIPCQLSYCCLAGGIITTF